MHCYHGNGVMCSPYAKRSTRPNLRDLCHVFEQVINNTKIHAKMCMKVGIASYGRYLAAFEAVVVQCLGQISLVEPVIFETACASLLRSRYID